MMATETPAEVFERYLVPAILAPWAPDLVALAGLRTGERVLDLACGTGLVGRVAAEKLGRNGKIVGIDINPALLALGRSVSSNAGISIQWLKANAIALPISDSVFDAVLCQQGLQFFPDRPAALREGYRVLVPGGRFAVAVWQSIEHNTGQLAFAEALLRHVGEEAAARVHLAFSLGDAEELRGLLGGAGFSKISIQSGVKKARFPSASEFVRRVITSAFAGTAILLSEKTISAVIADVSVALESYLSTDGLVFPMEAQLAVGYKPIN